MPNQGYTVLNTNLTGTFLLTPGPRLARDERSLGTHHQYRLPLRRNRTGKQANCFASKASMIGLIDSLAREISLRDIILNTIAPGFVEMAMSTFSLTSKSARGSRCLPNTDKNIAHTITFLARKGAVSITDYMLDGNDGTYMG